MKVAVIIARTAKGWQPVICGEQVAEIRAGYKEIKVAGFFEVNGEPADMVMYFDTAGDMKRKGLDPAGVVKAREKIRLAAEAEEVARANRVTEAAEETAAKIKAKHVAQLAVGVIASAIAAEGASPSPAAPAAPEAPAEPAAVAPAPEAPVTDAPSSVAAPAAAEVASDEDDARNHFGGGNQSRGGNRRR